ncbi:MAG: alpha/beta hydrolase-fold protein, partial [Clostridia bacterium]
MAILTMHSVFESIQLTTCINMIIPDSVRMDNIPLSERKVLYLLHGLSDDGTMWLRRSKIESYAEKYGLVVVMPSADRSFYCDGYDGKDYYTYITSDLPKYLHNVFNLSNNKENNFIAGISMGGYGAMRIALKNSNNYFAVGSFSGPLAFNP